MWYLINSDGEYVYIKPNEELIFGRKKGQILLKNDESISRLHASISIQPKEMIMPNETTSICKLKDIESKYGTYIIMGEERIQVSEEGYDLKDQDIIRFGLQQHTFKVIYIPLITVVSTLGESDKLELQNLIDEIDGVMSVEWTNICTHLTVSKATLTEKVTWAMASAVPIVTMNYWKQVKHAIDNGEPLPKSEDFVPPIREALVTKRNISLCVNEKRRTLFQSLIFVHFNRRQYKTFGKMINMAGGKSLLYTNRPLTNKEICSPNVVVLQYSDSDTMQSTQSIVPEYESIYNTLHENKRRMVTESEIALAILHCSVEKYCNPKYKFGEMLKRPQLKSDSSEVLALDTQDVRILPKVISNIPVMSTLNMHNRKRKFEIIPETCDTYSNDDLLRNDSNSQLKERLTSNILKDSTHILKKSREERDIFPSGTAVEIDSKENAEAICFTKNTKYIPETYDSSILDMSPKNTQKFTQKTQTCTQDNSSVQSSEQLKQSMLANKGTPFNEMKDFSIEESQECEIIHKDANKFKNTNIFSMKKESNKLSDIHNVRNESPEIREIILSNNYNEHTFKDDENVLKAVSLTTGKGNNKSKNSGKDSYEFYNDEEFITSTRKEISTDDSHVDRTKRALQVTVSSGSNDSHRNLSRCSSSFLRANSNFKKFQKVYNMTPKKRITLSNMYVWNRCTT